MENWEGTGPVASWRTPHAPHCRRCRLGGRINTATLCHGGQERKVDLGATFICGGCPAQAGGRRGTFARWRAGSGQGSVV